MRAALVIGWLALLTGCQTTAQPAKPAVTMVAPATLTQAQIALVHAGVRNILKDPESARFGSIVASQGSDGNVHICGYVNAKNSYGGYGGMQLFEAKLNGSNVFNVYGPSNLLELTCGEKGLLPNSRT